MKRSTVVLVAVIATVASGGAPAPATAQGGPGFLFSRPKVSLGFRAGYAFPRAGGDLFDFTSDEFIPLGAHLGSSLDYDAPYFGGELAYRPGERWGVALGVGWTRSRRMTEYRDWFETVGAARVPIAQETTFQVVTGTLGAKYSLRDRGRQVGSLAWVPRRVVPFVGAGVGVAWYDFRQEGDFVDTSDCELVNGEESCVIYSDYLLSRDEGFVGYGSAGVDVTVFKNAIVTAEARYSFSRAHVRGSYVGFGDVDLSGLQLMIGMGFQF